MNYQYTYYFEAIHGPTGILRKLNNNINHSGYLEGCLRGRGGPVQLGCVKKTTK